jgi:hypothetical protein
MNKDVISQRREFYDRQKLLKKGDFTILLITQMP